MSLRLRAQKDNRTQLLPRGKAAERRGSCGYGPAREPERSLPIPSCACLPLRSLGVPKEALTQLQEGWEEHRAKCMWHRPSTGMPTFLPHPPGWPLRPSFLEKFSSAGSSSTVSLAQEWENGPAWQLAPPHVLGQTYLPSPDWP